MIIIDRCYRYTYSSFRATELESLPSAAPCNFPLFFTSSLPPSLPLHPSALFLSSFGRIIHKLIRLRCDLTVKLAPSKKKSQLSPSLTLSAAERGITLRRDCVNATALPTLRCRFKRLNHIIIYFLRHIVTYDSSVVIATNRTICSRGTRGYRFKR